MPTPRASRSRSQHRLWAGMRTGQWLSTATVDLSKVKAAQRRGGPGRQARAPQGKSPRLTRYLAPQVSRFRRRGGPRDLDLCRSPSVRRAQLPGESYPKASGPIRNISRYLDRSRAVRHLPHLPARMTHSTTPRSTRNARGRDPQTRHDGPRLRAPADRRHNVGCFIFDTGAGRQRRRPEGNGEVKARATRDCGGHKRPAATNRARSSRHARSPLGQ